MFQKFHTDTLVSRYVKSVLAQAPIPVFDCVENGENIIADCYYVYKRFIIRCKDSGILYVDESENLFPGNTLYPSVFLYPGSGYKAAKFYVISRVETADKKILSTYNSKSNYYDSETHYYLAKYLRYLKSTTGLNLLPFYNMYNSTYVSNVYLSEQNYDINLTRRTNDSVKVTAIPILFGKTYKIYVDSDTDVFLRASLYDGAIIDESLLDATTQETLKHSGARYKRCYFNQPITFRIDTSEKSTYMLERNLHLLIQLSSRNNSSIVVLEDVDSSEVFNLSLIRYNTSISYAFSFRLFEYLIGHNINQTEHIKLNIETAQDIIAKSSKSYVKPRYPVWDNLLSNEILRIAKLIDKDVDILDQDGSFNRDFHYNLKLKGKSY